MKQFLFISMLFFSISVFAEPRAVIYDDSRFIKNPGKIQVEIKLFDTIARAADFSITFIDYFGDRITLSKKLGNGYITGGDWIVTTFYTNEASLIDKIEGFIIKIATPEGEVLYLPTDVSTSEKE